jgi:hypothetical protein
MADDHAFGSRHDANPGDDPGADLEVSAPRGERREFEERSVEVDQQLDTFSDGELASVSVALDVLGSTPAPDLVEKCLVLVEEDFENLGVGDETLG